MSLTDQKAIVRDFFDKVVYYTPYEERYVKRTNLNAYDILKRKDVVMDCVDRLGLAGGKLLDIGCGPAVYTPDLAARGFEVWGVDLAPGVVERARDIMDRTPAAHQVHFSVGDIDRLEFDDHTFDVVLVVGLFDYLVSDEAALTEVRRVLKPGGVALISLQNRYCYRTLVRSILWPLRPLLRRVLGGRLKLRELCGDHATKTHVPHRFHRTAHALGLTPILQDHVNFNLIPLNLPGSLPRFYFALLNVINDSPTLRARLPWLYGSHLVVLRNDRA